MSSRDPWSAIPNLSSQSAERDERGRVADPSRFYPSPRAGVVDAVTGRILDIPRVCVYRTTVVGINPAVLAPLPFEAELYDEDKMWDATDPFKIYARTPGLYEWKASVNWAANTASYRQILVRKNGVTYLPHSSIVDPSQVTSTGQATSTECEMSAGDYVEVIVSHNATVFPTALNINSGLENTAITGHLASTFGSDNQ